MQFSQMNLPEYILRALDKFGYVEPTDIQQRAIPIIMAGNDAVGKSRTGSGKTFAFGIPALDICDSQTRCTEVLILSPTRELALQITEEIRKLSTFKEGCKVVPLFGGSSIERQIIALKRNAKIVVGTPGRIMDHIKRRTLELSNVKMLVLDEADEMLDMGFRDDMESIIKKTNEDRVTVMFSATMPKPILEISKKYMKNPQFIEVDATGENLAVKQLFTYVGEKDKFATIVELIGEIKPERSIIFCNTKRMVDKLTTFLKENNINAEGLHGDMKQFERKKVLDSMKKGNLNFLIATDVAARGIDINDVDAVINFDLPLHPDYYVHRIGRTARAGKTGRAYTIINTRSQLSLLDEIMEITDNEVDEYVCTYSKLSDKDRGAKSRRKPTNAQKNQPKKMEKVAGKRQQPVKKDRKNAFKEFEAFKEEGGMNKPQRPKPAKNGKPNQDFKNKKSDNKAGKKQPKRGSAYMKGITDYLPNEGKKADKPTKKVERKPKSKNKFEKFNYAKRVNKTVKKK